MNGRMGCPAEVQGKNMFSKLLDGFRRDEPFSRYYATALAKTSNAMNADDPQIFNQETWPGGSALVYPDRLYNNGTYDIVFGTSRSK
jgi:hypothetical protein